MIEINLLPKDYRKSGAGFQFGKTGVYALVGAVGVVVLLIAITFYQIHQVSQLEENIERASQRSAMLRNDIQVVDALIDVKTKIHRRMTAVERLDRYRSAWVRIMEDIARNVPEFVWLARFEEIPPPPPDPKAKKDTTAVKLEPPSLERPSVRPVEIQGYTFTLNALAAFMIKTMRSDYFDEVELIETKDTVFVNEKAYKFQLTARVHYLSDEELRNLVAQTGVEDDAKSGHKSLN